MSSLSNGRVVIESGWISSSGSVDASACIHAAQVADLSLRAVSTCAAGVGLVFTRSTLGERSRGTVDVVWASGGCSHSLRRAILRISTVSNGRSASTFLLKSAFSALPRSCRCRVVSDIADHRSSVYTIVSTGTPDLVSVSNTNAGVRSI